MGRTDRPSAESGHDPVEAVDVVVVGAGISGIDAAQHLRTRCPDRSFTVLEARDTLGGTWDLFRYPGVRSDSDMHTLGFGFRPWRGADAIADGPSILAYLRETVDELDLERHLRYGHRVTRAEWSGADATWTLDVDRGEGEVASIRCNFLVVCAGYYSYHGGHTPEFAGRERFGGLVVHPQDWPADLDVGGKRVVVIGSGATAVTLVPALAGEAAHVTMLQRSPTYVVARPSRDRLAAVAHAVLPDRVASRIVRRKNAILQELLYQRTRHRPEQVRAHLLGAVREALPDVDVDTHFTPTYDPWDQRLCLVPDGDLFEAIRSGRASVVTDHITTFTETGIALASGDELPADVVVTATGLEIVTLGEIDLVVDGAPVDLSQTWTYKGLAYSDVPNLVSTFGYVNASWTLRADLVSDYVCRLLNHMAAIGAVQCTPRLRASDHDMVPRPWIDDFSAGYLQRALPHLPRQGDREPWVNVQRYSVERRSIGTAPVDDGVMRFTARRVEDAPTP